MQWYKLSESQIQELKEFQRIMGYLYKLYYEKNNHKKEDIENFANLVEQDLSTFPFLQDIHNQLQKVMTEINKINPERLREVNKQLLDSQPQFVDFFDNLDKGIVSDFSVEDITTLLEESKATGRPITDIVNNHLYNYIERSSAALFFSGGKKQGLLVSFEKNDWSKLVTEPIKKYSYLPFVNGMSAEGYIYFIQALSDKPAKIKLHPESFKDYLDFRYNDNPKWKELKQLVDDYQHNNSKAVLKEAVKLMQKFSELVEYHNKLKSQFERLYRGVGTNEYLSDQEITKEEHNLGIVATSTNSSAATNFAYGRGHLMGDTQTNEYAYLLTYSVTPKDIILDTSLFGELYGESEVLINSKSAVLKEIEQLPDVTEKEDYED